MRFNVVAFQCVLLFTGLPCGADELSQTTVPVKNLILLIGDGMGPQQMGLLTTYASQAPNSRYKDKKTAIEQAMDKGVIGLIRTSPPGVLVTDSAAAATQLASGVAAGAEMVGIGGVSI